MIDSRTYAGPPVMTPGAIAGRAAISELEKLLAMAKGGDNSALRSFHQIACNSVEILNEHYPDFAASVLKWPVVMPQEKEARKAVAEKAKRMDIGAVKAVAMGRPEDSAYTSDKGFAIENLQRVSKARYLLRLSEYDGLNNHTVGELGDDGFWTGWCADEEFMAIAFTGTTEIETIDQTLLIVIRDLPDYSAVTRKQWVDVIAKVLKANPHLVPEIIRERGLTPTSNTRRGDPAKSALRRILAKVSAVPDAHT